MVEPYSVLQFGVAGSPGHATLHVVDARYVQIASHAVSQQYLSEAQTLSTHASHPIVSFMPWTHTSCAHIEPPPVTVEELEAATLEAATLEAATLEAATLEAATLEAATLEAATLEVPPCPIAPAPPSPVDAVVELESAPPAPDPPAPEEPKKVTELVQATSASEARPRDCWPTGANREDIGGYYGLRRDEAPSLSSAGMKRRPGN